MIYTVAARAADKLKFTLGMDFKAAKARVTEYIRRDIGTIAVRGIASMLLLRRRYAATHQASVAGHSAESGGTSDDIGHCILGAVERMTHERAGRGG